MLRTEGYTWGPYLWRTTIASDTVGVILNRANGIRGDKSATPMLPFNFEDQWHFPSKDVDWFWGIFKPHLKKYLLSYSRHNELNVPTEDEPFSKIRTRADIGIYSKEDLNQGFPFISSY